MLFDNGYTNYLGVDISEVAIEQAKTVNEKYGSCFQCADVFHWIDSLNEGREAIYICLEMMEHIVNDITLVERIPAGSKMVFSLPSFMSFNHVRCFSNMDEIKKRYSNLNVITHISICASDVDDTKRWYIVLAEKR